MNRRDYVELAEALKKVRESCLVDIAGSKPVCDQHARAVADVCAIDPRFDRERFLKNAGVK